MERNPSGCYVYGSNCQSSSHLRSTFVPSGPESSRMRFVLGALLFRATVASSQIRLNSSRPTSKVSDASQSVRDETKRTRFVRRKRNVKER